jgi:hypothetical protein
MLYMLVLLFVLPDHKKHYFLYASHVCYAFWSACAPPPPPIPFLPSDPSRKHKKHEKHIQNKVFYDLEAEKARKAYTK